MGIEQAIVVCKVYHSYNSPMPDSRDKASIWINVALVVALLLAPVAWYAAAVNGPELHGPPAIPDDPPITFYSGPSEADAGKILRLQFIRSAKRNRSFLDWFDWFR